VVKSTVWMGQLPSRKAGPLYELDDKVDSDQWVVSKELSV